MTKRNVVVLESPYAGAVRRNTAYARKCLLYSLEHDEAPFAGHLLYTQVWNDLDPKERNAGIEADLCHIDVCDYLVVNVDYGTSSGMKRAIDYARSIGKPVMYRCPGLVRMTPMMYLEAIVGMLKDWFWARP